MIGMFRGEIEEMRFYLRWVIRTRSFRSWGTGVGDEVGCMGMRGNLGFWGFLW